MEPKDVTLNDRCELRPVVGLTRELPPADVETLTINAIRVHRRLVEKADELFQALPDTYKTGKVAGGEQHLCYIEASIEMHAQMSALNTLISVLGYVPSVAAD